LRLWSERPTFQPDGPYDLWVGTRRKPNGPLTKKSLPPPGSAPYTCQVNNGESRAIAESRTSRDRLAEPEWWYLFAADRRF